MQYYTPAAMHRSIIIGAPSAAIINECYRWPVQAVKWAHRAWQTYRHTDRQTDIRAYMHVLLFRCVYTCHSSTTIAPTLDKPLVYYRIVRERPSTTAIDQTNVSADISHLRERERVEACWTSSLLYARRTRRIVRRYHSYTSSRRAK